MFSGSCFRFQGVVSVFRELFPFSGKCFRFLGCVFVNLNLFSLTLICLTGMGHRTSIVAPIILLYSMLLHTNECVIAQPSQNWNIAP